MKVALVNPPFLFADGTTPVRSHCLGLRYLSAVLKAHGHAVTFIDALLEGWDERTRCGEACRVGLRAEAVADLVPRDAGIIGVSAPFSHLAPVVHELVAVVKRARPAARVCLGGVYPSTQPAQALSSRADCIVVGEGEVALARLAGGEAPESIRGVYRPGQAGPFPSAEAPADLDALPFPDLEVPRSGEYFRLSPRGRKGGVASVITSRGCPFDCEFCSVHPVCGYKWRGRSPGNVLAEIRDLAGRFGVRTIEFEDDNLSLDRDRFRAILEGLIRLNEDGAGIGWRTPNGLRIDTFDPETIRLMRRAGALDVTLALEHGDPEMLRIMRKRLDLDVAHRVIADFVAAGLPDITVFYIVGYPGETRARHESGLAFLRRIKALGGNVRVCPNIAQPYPGTALYERCREAGFIPQAAGDGACFNTADAITIVTPDFDRAEVRRRKEEIIAVFYPAWKMCLRRVLPVPMRQALERMAGG